MNFEDARNQMGIVLSAALDSFDVDFVGLTKSPCGAIPKRVKRLSSIAWYWSCGQPLIVGLRFRQTKRLRTTVLHCAD